jgi:hypothetical protein
MRAWTRSWVNALPRLGDCPVGLGNFQCPSQPRDVARLGYCPVSKVCPGGLDYDWSPPGTPAGGTGL